MTATHSRRLAWLTRWAAPALIAAGCGTGTVIVDYAVDAQVAMRDGNGTTQEIGAIVTVPRHAELASPFDAVQYRGEDFEWIFGTGTLGLGGSITNRSDKPLCLRFDQARIRSNLHPEPVALKTYHWSIFRESWSQLGSTDPKQRQDFTPPTFCLDPGKAARISFSPDLRSLFATQKMFNVRWPGNEPQLSVKVVG